MSDLIDRTSMAEHKFPGNECNGLGEGHAYRQGWNDAIDAIIDNAPSAELEPLTDKEQRIFLAAMSREEKVCKQVDEECRDCREPYEDSLVGVCHEITRKVKAALWET